MEFRRGWCCSLSRALLLGFSRESRDACFFFNVDSVALLTAAKSKTQSQYFVNLLICTWMIFRSSIFLGSWLGCIRCVRCQLFNALMSSLCSGKVNLWGHNSLTAKASLSDLFQDCRPQCGAAGLFRPANKSRRSGKYRRATDSTPSLGQSWRQKPLQDIFS